MRSRVLLIVLLVVTALTVVAEEKKPSWKMSGQLEEACSCNAACPCWFGSKPTRSQCSGGFALFIDKGSYGNVPLDGLGVAFIGASKEGTTMMASMGDWDFVTVYIDEKANPEQRKALEAIMRETSPPAAPPERTRFAYVPITRKIEGSEHIVTLGNYGGFSAHLLPGGMGGAPKISNPPGADPIHKEYLQGVTTKQTYTDSGKKWDWSNSNYMYGTFQTDSDEYTKFSAAMAQQMEKGKSEKH
ncbi:MAG: DUF1326 domain-containing protein [Thermoanaerobaculia bacterium]